MVKGACVCDRPCVGLGGRQGPSRGVNCVTDHEYAQTTHVYTDTDTGKCIYTRSTQTWNALSLSHIASMSPV